MNRRNAIFVSLLLTMCTLSFELNAQQSAPPTPGQTRGGQPGPPPQGAPPPRGPGQGGREAREGGPSADLQMPPGRWWDDPNIAQTIGLSPAQIKKMDDTFNGSRDHLIDLDAAVRKAEGGLQPLLESDPIDRAKILAQIDRLTQAKAELEKTSAQMLLDILRIAPAPSAGALSFTNTDTTNRP